MTTFVNERLPEDIERGASGGPTFLTTVMELAGGTEKRNVEWSRPRQEWDISYGIQDPDGLDEIIALFYICHGRAYGFRFKDWSDYKIGNPDDGTLQQIGVGTGAEDTYQIVKNYIIGSDSYSRKITRIVEGTLKVYLQDNVFQTDTLQVEDTDYTIDYDTGIIVFAANVTNAYKVRISCEFDVPVRFDTDSLKKKVTWERAEEIPSIQIIELKE